MYIFLAVDFGSNEGERLTWFLAAGCHCLGGTHWAQLAKSGCWGGPTAGQQRGSGFRSQWRVWFGCPHTLGSFWVPWFSSMGTSPGSSHGNLCNVMESCRISSKDASKYILPGIQFPATVKPNGNTREVSLTHSGEPIVASIIHPSIPVFEMCIHQTNSKFSNFENFKYIHWITLLLVCPLWKRTSGIHSKRYGSPAHPNRFCTDERMKRTHIKADGWILFPLQITSTFFILR